MRTALIVALALTVVPAVVAAQTPAQPPPPPQAPAATQAAPAPALQPVSAPVAVGAPQPVYAQPGYPQAPMYYPPPGYYPYPRPMRTRYVEAGNGPPPPGAVEVTRYNRPLVISGAVMVGALYLVVGAAVGFMCVDPYIQCNGALLWLFAPVAGPFIAAAQPGIVPAGTALLVMDGVLQTTGVVLGVLGIVTAHRMYRITEPYGRNGPRFTIAPVAAGAPIGVTLGVVAF
jgi:hypothetical protein